LWKRSRPVDRVFVRSVDVVQYADEALYSCASNKAASDPAAVFDDRPARIVAAPRT
jgi:hypothetical protein